MARKRLVRKAGAVGLSLSGSSTKKKRTKITNPNILAENAALAEKRKGVAAATGSTMKAQGVKHFLSLVDDDYRKRFYDRWPGGKVDLNFFGYWDLLYLSTGELSPDKKGDGNYADSMGTKDALTRWNRLKDKLLAKDSPATTVPSEFVIYDPKLQPKEERKIVNPMELTRNKARDILMECETIALEANKKSCILSYLRKESISSMVANMIRDDFMSYYQGLTKDEEKIYGLKAQSDWVQLLAVELDQYAEEAKNQSKRSSKSRKPQARYAKGFSPGAMEKALASFGHQAVDDSLGISSVSPDQVFGAGMVLLFNTKYRKVTLLEAPPNSVLGLKGTSIIGFDASTAVEKTCKNPKKLLDWSTKPKTRKSVTTLKTKEAKGNGRSNKETVILAVFK